MQKKRTQKLSLEKVKEVITQDVPRIFLVGALMFMAVGLVSINQGRQTKVESQDASSVLQDLFRNKPGIKALATSQTQPPTTTTEKRTPPSQPPAVAPGAGSPSSSAEKNPVCPQATSPAGPLPSDKAQADNTPACTGNLPGNASPKAPDQPGL